MRLFEYQGKELLKKIGIPISQGEVVDSDSEAAKLARKLGDKVAVKAQVLVGGRGKAGGIIFADSPKEAKHAARSILGSKIKHQEVKRVLITKQVDIKEELYVGVTLDRFKKKPAVIFSTQGGVNIEEVAKKNPQAIQRLYVHPLEGIQPYQIRKILFKSGFKNGLFKPLYKIIDKLYGGFLNYSATLVEINPLAITNNGNLIALDSKFIIDDDALFKLPEVQKYARTAGNSLEEQAKQAGLQYVKLDGNIGVVGNGAGLVMATLDVIQNEGGKPANFLDIGGGASSERVRGALEILSSDKRIRGILVNIFGGITRCDQVAYGIISAKENVELTCPMVVRLTGTSEKKGREILERSKITHVSSLEKGVEKIIQLID